MFQNHDKEYNRKIHEKFMKIDRRDRKKEQIYNISIVKRKKDTKECVHVVRYRPS